MTVKLLAGFTGVVEVVGIVGTVVAVVVDVVVVGVVGAVVVGGAVMVVVVGRVLPPPGPREPEGPMAKPAPIAAAPRAMAI
ncbi:hypothetical protein ABIE38_003516 [Dietzia sp. 2505]|uniref:hypothetical protein n=1 Tax=unclassified Dietzia TaxID=2617939 RepID=UPI0015FA8AED|nr:MULTISPECIES: hypothetical protein [unclassified Dietzia]